MTRKSGWVGPVEFLIVIMCISGIMITGYFLFQSSFQNSKHHKIGERVGSIKPMGSDVRLRGDVETAWQKINGETDVYRYDRVYTGDSSEAKVDLDLGATLTVEPNSLIVIDDLGDFSAIDLSMGSFVSEIKKGTKLFVRHQGQHTEISSEGATFHIQSKGANKKLQLVVLSGQINVKGGQQDQSQILSANEAATIEGSTMSTQTLPISLVSPRPRELVWKRIDHPIRFSWRKPSHLQRVYLEIATDSEFRSVVKTIETEESYAEITLPDDKTYFWRVTSSEKSISAESPVANFKLKTLIPPQIAKEAEIEIEANEHKRVKEAIHFSWIDPLESEKYQFILAKETNFENVTLSHFTHKKEVRINNLEFGTYYWKVTSQSEDRPDLSSIIGRLILREKEVPSMELVSAQKPEPPIETVRQPAHQSEFRSSSTLPTKKVTKTKTKTVAKRSPTSKKQTKTKAKSSKVVKNEQQKKPFSSMTEKAALPTHKEDDKKETFASAFYGLKRLSLNQNKTLGSAEVAVPLPHYLGVNVRHRRKKWDAWFNLDSYNLKFRSTSSSGSGQFHSFRLAGGRKWYWGGLHYEQLPLFRNNSGIIELTKQSFLFATLGTKHEWNVHLRKPTLISATTYLKYPFSLSTESPVSISRFSGYGLGAQFEFRWLLHTLADQRKWYLIWPTQIDWTSMTQEVVWTPSEGTVNSQFFSFDTSIGAQFEF